MAGRDDFEALYAEHRGAVERFVRFRMKKSDADDVIQDTVVNAYAKFGELRNRDAFLPWMLSIARNKCRDAYRTQMREVTVTLDEDSADVIADEDEPPAVAAVREILSAMIPEDREVLTFAYLDEIKLADIAKTLSIPLGTVKSRLHSARGRFRKAYEMRYYVGRAERQQNHTEDRNMKKTVLPDIMPEYTITRSEKEPFSVRCEEMIGWLIVPKEGERLSWGLYDSPSGTRTEWTEMKVTGRAEVHGIEGALIKAIQHDAEDYYRTGSIAESEWTFVVQLTDMHCRVLLSSHEEDGVQKMYTFLDGDVFMQNWGFGEDNCGTEIELSPKGKIVRSGNVITGEHTVDAMDVVGRYNVTIGGRTYDTVCVMDIDCFNDAVASEQYIDQNGRTVLWRRFNRDDWAYNRYGKKWTEMLPENERLTVNGEVYVHWYDCISDYIIQA